MTSEGPSLQMLMHRMTECPADFLAEPLIRGKGSVHVAAVVSDLLLDLGESGLDDASATPFVKVDASARNRLRVVLVTTWLLHDPWFLRERFAVRKAGKLRERIYSLLTDDVAELAELVEAPHFVSDPDRAEELVRLVLKSLDLRPSGESDVQAQDRLTTISTLEQRRVIAATRKAHERAEKLRKAMAKKAAAAAAAKAARE